MQYKYHEEGDYTSAPLGNGLEVDDEGGIFTPLGKVLHKLPYPKKEVRTPLTWTTERETRTTTVTCTKLTGTHSMNYPSGSRESSDGMRGATTGGRGRVTFIKDKYQVTVHYTVVVATNNLGEKAVYSADIPSDLSYETGYGKLSEYTLEKEAIVPPLPTEKVERTSLPRKEVLKYFYDEALAWCEANPYTAPPPPPFQSGDLQSPCPYKEGDMVYHSTYGIVKVVSLMGDGLTLAISSNRGIKIVMVSDLSLTEPTPLPSGIKKPVLKKK